MDSPWVVIPTYNERTNIERLIPALLALPVPNLSVLIVDDNSPDGTAEATRSLQQHNKNIHLLVREKKSGLGPAYIHGFTYALEHGASAVVQMDADFSHDPNDIPKLLRKLKEYDVVVGSRYTNGISVINWPLRRLIISVIGNSYARLVTGLPFKDVTGGFRVWRSNALKTITSTKIEADGYSFQIATGYRAWKKGLKIHEVPIIFTERREGRSKMSKAIVMEAIWLVWKLRLFG
jgi:dolichol-phosphate mannosyltransferase